MESIEAYLFQSYDQLYIVKFYMKNLFLSFSEDCLAGFITQLVCKKATEISKQMKLI